MKKGHYAVVGHDVSGGIFQNVFWNKEKAEAAFQDAWVFNGEVALLQGNFYQNPYSGFIRASGRSFVLITKDYGTDWR